MPSNKLRKFGAVVTSAGAVMVGGAPSGPNAMLALLRLARSTDQLTMPTVGIPPAPALSAVCELTVKLHETLPRPVPAVPPVAEAPAVEPPVPGAPPRPGMPA